MKIFYSEYLKNYSSYTFSYAVYALFEKNDSLTDLYNAGFLPYAGKSEYESNKTQKEIYYLCRSLRVNINKYSLNSENRRIEKKAEPFNIKMKILPKSEYLGDSHFNDFCQRYADERFKGGHMNKQRWNYVLNRNCGTHVFSFHSADQVLGYVLAGIDESSVHYWFSFFDTNYLNQFPIGKYLMLSVINWAEEKSKNYVYLGTCYGTNSLYKARDFKGTEFFDGARWNDDISILKSWCKQEDEDMESDRYKSLIPPS